MSNSRLRRVRFEETETVPGFEVPGIFGAGAATTLLLHDDEGEEGWSGAEEEDEEDLDDDDFDDDDLDDDDLDFDDLDDDDEDDDDAWEDDLDEDDEA